MAKLNDLIKRATRPDPNQMGFAATSPKAQATMLLVAIAGDHWARATSDAASARADVIVLQGKPGDRDVSDAVAAAGERPVGVTLNDSSLDMLPRLRDAKADFIVVGTNAPAGALVEEELAVVLQLRDDLSDVQLRALAPTTLDAIHFDRDVSPATIMKLLEVQRVGGLAGKPLLVPANADASKEELTALRDAGVVMLCVDMKERNAVDALKKLSGTIASLPKRASRKKEHREPLLPVGSGAAGHDHDADEDDDD
jgi:hypothetical protein